MRTEEKKIQFLKENSLKIETAAQGHQSLIRFPEKLQNQTKTILKSDQK